MSPRQLLLILRARWGFALSVFAAVLFLAVLVTFMLPTMYTATVSVVVEVKADPVSNLVYQPQAQASDIATQVDIIESHRVAQRVVKLLKLDEAPDFKSMWLKATAGRGDPVEWLGERLMKRLTVAPAKESNVIQISIKWRDPKAAAALANAFARAYIETNIELKVDSAKQYAGLFDDQSRALRADLEAKQKRLSDYQNAQGIVATTDDKLDVENERLAELSTQLVTIESQRQQSQSRQHQANGNVESLPEVLQNPVIGSLKAELSQAEAKRQDIATTMGKNYPDYKDVEAEIAGLRERIAQESARIAASLGSNVQGDLRRENDVKMALEAQKKRILDLKHQHDQVAVLQNDVTTAQHNLDSVAQRLAQSSLESQTHQTNIALLTAASEPLEPSSPKLLINVLLGMFLGVVCGVGAALLREMGDRRVRQGEDLVGLIGVPLIGRIPDTTGEARQAQSTPYMPLTPMKSPSG